MSVKGITGRKKGSETHEGSGLDCMIKSTSRGPEKKKILTASTFISCRTKPRGYISRQACKGS